ncbi:MAG: aldo/keto reductase [Rhizobacter sp.]|nr:aldo/keto reductase [Rhizobacter sp.]
MHSRRIGDRQVSSIGMGCMNLSHAYAAPPPPEVGEKLLLRALQLGVTMFDTAALYGFGSNETLVGRVLKSHRSKILLASKGGMAGVNFPDGMKRVIDGSPAAIRRNCEDSLKRLQTEVIDLYYLHRWDKQVPVEDSVGAMADLVREGKLRLLGLSEVSAATLRRAHAVHPIAAVQNEYSLWTRNPEIALLAACKELGAALVAFSPTARAFLTGKLRDVSTLDAKDIRRGMPRFYPDNYAANLRLLDGYARIAEDAGCTMAQLSIAWVLAQGDHVIALPGTTNIEHLEENLGADRVALSAHTLQRLDELINRDSVTGPRYNAGTQAEIDTEEFS